MNEYDSNRIFDLAKKIGYSPTLDIDDSNCIIINTCHIREKATDKIYHEVGRLKKRFSWEYGSKCESPRDYHRYVAG